MKNDSKTLYNNQADNWSRTEPILLSDYSARPFVINLCQPVKDCHILDLGCGEGYVGRKLLEAGASKVHGIDISEKMIEHAEKIKNENGFEQLSYEVLDVSVADLGSEQKYDTVLAMFLFNYLDVESTHAVIKKVFDLLKPGGHFVFSVPHPFLAFLKKDKFPFYFETQGGYFSGRNILFPGEIWRRDRISVGVQCVHKTFEDYFSGLKSAGFTTMPELYELRINEDHVKLDPEFFSPLIDLPLHLAFKIKK
jgi:2-polyprenyl-3-methyl-5-hydroxy-6-metoxy-1,4-benzoquinol methylase